MDTQINHFDIIGEYCVITTLANGGFGIVYFVRDRQTNLPYAMKMEKVNAHKSLIQIEYSVLKQIQGSLYFPRLFGTGNYHDRSYMVMELLGPSLSRIRNFLPNNRFSLSTSLRIGIEMVCVLREFHSRGFVHRDIKPSNFLVRPNSPTPICLIDFGFSKRFIDPTTNTPHKMRSSKSYGCFIGTVKYASINAHKHIDLGPRDDMICWFNTMAELITGRLPWSDIKDKDEIFRVKEELSLSPERRCQDLPSPFISIYQHITNLEYDQFPDYDAIVVFLSEAWRSEKAKIQRHSSNEDIHHEENHDNETEEPYDWELLDNYQRGELFPPSVMNARRLSASGIFPNSIKPISIESEIKAENPDHDNGPNSDRHTHQYDPLNGKKYSQNANQVEKFHLLESSDSSERRCLRCPSCCIH